MQERVKNPAEVIDFSGLLVIVGGGTVDTELLSELYLRGGHLVGADGGADVIADVGFKPEAIIGDLDSLKDPVSWLGRTRIINLAEQ